MNRADIVDLSSDDDLGEVDVKPVIVEPDIIGGMVKQKHQQNAQAGKLDRPRAQESEENRSSIAFSAGNSSNSVLEQGHSPVDDTVVSSMATLYPAPVCRQFWKAGDYDGGAWFESHAPKYAAQESSASSPHVPHSNATSHKWAFGAVAELLDNAIHEIQNGATFVIVDKISNPKDGSPALLIQDDGGGMGPDAMQLCMSFGFSNRKSKSAIGQYGNGFKTSSMRLGADVIVFSHHLNSRPLDVLHGREHFVANLAILLEWSPYSTEAELLKEFDDIDSHGTKIIIYNLWFNNDGKLDLDFDSDTKDIRIQGDTKRVGRAVNELHIANQYNYSLRLYLSILYLRVPETLRIVLRGEVVEHHNVVDDLKYIEYILYRPQSVGNMENTVLTTIGFLKEAPQVNIHGFCVYHKNHLILPFWQVVSYSDNSSRGVVGALEANSVKPTHNKQDFERTSLFQKLECHLKEMTWEYWDYDCGLIGYQPKKKPRLPEFSQILSDYAGNSGLHTKRKEQGNVAEFEKVKRRAGNGANAIVQPANTFSNHLEDEEANMLMQENKKLRAKCLEYKKRGEELETKVTQLRNEIGEVEGEYGLLLKELESLDIVKEEKNVHK